MSDDSTHGFDDGTMPDAGPIPWGREAWGDEHQVPVHAPAGNYDGRGDGNPYVSEPEIDPDTGVPFATEAQWRHALYQRVW